MDGFFGAISELAKIKEVASEVEALDQIKPEDKIALPKNKEYWDGVFKDKFYQEIPGSEIIKKMKMLKELDKKYNDTNDDSEAKNCPVNDGMWTGKRGNSKWLPDPDYIPKKQNPEGRMWKEILDYFGIDGIEFVNGEPDFSEVSKGDVEIDDFSTNRDDNFDQADIKLAEQRGCTPSEVAKWRKEHNYTWHECSDMKSMQKVPSVIHNNIPHSGGVSEAKRGLGEKA